MISWNIIRSVLPLTFLVFSLAFAGGKGGTDVRPWSVRIADSFLQRHPGAVTYDSASPNERWNYEQGLMLEAFCQMWFHTRERKYFDFVKGNMDRYVGENGSIRTYNVNDYTLDNIGPGRALLTLYQETGDRKYKFAADSLREQLRMQPRTHEGGFWHKKLYPYQMWLDGLFMAEPFYSWYAVEAKENGDFDDVINQFVFMAEHARDSKTGLFYHGWDESRQQRWANPATGCSPNFWGRAMGWYSMALVDVLDFIPAWHPRRDTLITILRDLASSEVKFRDEKTGLWYQIVDQKERNGNYLEASASCMFVYTFAKGANKGYLDVKYLREAESSFKWIIDNLVTVNDDGTIDLLHTCMGAGLGGNPYRDGSFDYYVNEQQRTNDMKGLGPFLLAAIELEKWRSGRIVH